MKFQFFLKFQFFVFFRHVISGQTRGCLQLAGCYHHEFTNHLDHLKIYKQKLISLNLAEYWWSWSDLKLGLENDLKVIWKSQIRSDWIRSYIQNAIWSKIKFDEVILIWSQIMEKVIWQYSKIQCPKNLKRHSRLGVDNSTLRREAHHDTNLQMKMRKNMYRPPSKFQNFHHALLRPSIIRVISWFLDSKIEIEITQ